MEVQCEALPTEEEGTQSLDLGDLVVQSLGESYHVTVVYLYRLVWGDLYLLHSPVRCEANLAWDISSLCTQEESPFPGEQGFCSLELRRCIYIDSRAHECTTLHVETPSRIQVERLNVARGGGSQGYPPPRGACSVRVHEE